MKNFRQYFVLKFFHEEKFKMRKIFVKSLSDEIFSRTKKKVIYGMSLEVDQ